MPINEDYYPPILKGRYELLERLGEGGMGTVYRCLDTRTGQHHAIKFLTLDQVLSRSGVQRFVHEARLLSHLRHPNIVRIHDFGVEDGIPFLIMELCLNQQGRPYTLKELQDNSPDHRLPVPVLLRLIPQMLSAAGLLHSQGLVHRDLKPENFLLREEPDGTLSAKLSDFGLVAITGDQELQRQYELSISLSLQKSATKDRAWVGTYAYMSPEQKRGEQLDARSDVYSLGLIIYRLATGYERLNPELPSEVNPNLPEWIDFLVERALGDTPDGRWMTALKMYEILPPTLRDASLDPRGTGRWRRPLVLGLLMVVIGLGVGLFSQPRYRAWFAALLKVPAENPGQPPAAPPTPGSVSPVTPSTPDPDAVLRHLRDLRSDDPEVRGRAKTGLVALGRQSIAGLTEALADPSPEVRAAAVEVVGQLHEPQSVELLGHALVDRDDFVQLAAAEALVNQAAAAVPTLAGMLNNPDANVRGYVGYVLGQIGTDAWPAWIEGLAATDEGIRTQAVKHLRATAGPAIPALIDCLGTTSADKREGASRVLVEIGVDAVPELVGALSSDNVQIRTQSAHILGLLGAVEAAVPLTVLLKDPSPVVRQKAADALVNVGSPAAVPLVRLFREGDPSVCQYAANSLAAIGEGALPALIQSMHDDDPGMRRWVSQVLVQIGKPSTPALINALHDPDPVVRRSAAMSLARIHSQEGLRALLVSLQDRDTDVRELAAEALRSVGVEAVPPLVELLGDSDISVRRYAQALIIRQGKPSVPSLQRALDSPRSSVTIMAAEALVRLDATDTYPAIVLALGDRGRRNDAAEGLEVPSLTPVIQRHLQKLRAETVPAQRANLEAALVRVGTPVVPVLLREIDTLPAAQAAEAARLLGRIGHPAALPALVQALHDDSARYPELNIAAAEALGMLRHVAAVPPLLQAHRWKDARLREEAVRALGRIGQPSAVNALLVALRDERSNVRAAAAEALGLIGSPAALPGLLQATNDANYDTSRNATLAIRRIRQKTEGSP